MEPSVSSQQPSFFVQAAKVAGVGAIAGLFVYLYNESEKNRKTKESEQKAQRKRVERDLKIKTAWKTVEKFQKEQTELFEYINELSTQDLLQALREGKVSAVDALNCYSYNAIQAHRDVNCLADVNFTQAMKRAKELDTYLAENGKPIGPLHGLPISIKEHINLKGTDSTAGVPGNCFKENKENAVIVKALLSAGAVIFVKSNVPQTLLVFETCNPIYGTTLNPWNYDRTCGGSSGGEAALIASGGSTVGIGSDIGGSIRIPSHFCGIYGFKPTVGRLSGKGCTLSIKGQESVRSSLGPMGKSVIDLVSILDAVWTERQWSLDSLAPVPFDHKKFSSTKPLRIGYYFEDGFFESSASCKRAVEEAKEALESCGYELVKFKPPDVAWAARTYYYLMTADGGQTLLNSLHGEQIDSVIKPSLARLRAPAFVQGIISSLFGVLGWDRMSSVGRAVRKNKSVTDVWAKQNDRYLYKDGFIQKMKDENIDLLLTPGFATPAVPHGFSKELSPCASYTFIWNLLDFPAGTVPITIVSEEDIGAQSKRSTGDLLDRKADEVDSNSVGLPIGVQVVGLPWEDELVLRVMSDLEEKIGFKK